MAGLRLLGVAVAAAAGCGDSSGVFDGGARDHAVRDLALPPPLCDDRAGADGGLAATFANVQRLFDARCVGCHDASSDVNLTGGASYASLVGKKPPPLEDCGGLLVQKGSATSSYLYQKLADDRPCQGKRMPIEPTPSGGFEPRPLAACEIDFVRRWIDDGAPAQ